MRLSDRDYRAAFDVVRATAAADGPEGFTRAALVGLAELVASEITSLNEVEPAEGRFVYAAHPDTMVEPPGSVELFQRHADAHPLIAYADQTGDGSARRISDFLTTEEWHENPLYLGVYRPLGMEHQMSIALVVARPTTVAFAMNRSARDFDERDRAVLDLVRPHLAQSWRNARERARLRQLVGASALALDHDGSGVILLAADADSAGDAVEVTPGAFRELYRFFGRPGPTSSLPTAVDGWIATQRARRAAGELLRPQSARLGDRRLVLRLLPGVDGQPDAILLRGAPAEAAEPRLTALGLSAREAEVLALVGTGATNAQVAQQLHVAASTVKKHLDSVYRKLGVSGRGRAVAVMAEVLAHHPGA